MKIHVIMFVAIVMAASIQAQPPCMPDYPSFYFAIARPVSVPELDTEMPNEVRSGLVALDSISRTYGRTKVDSIFDARPDWDDTVQTFLKYLTILTDYNPLALLRHANTTEYRPYSHYRDIRIGIAGAIEQYSPSKSLDAALTSSDYIALVTVNDTVGLIDTGAKIARTVRVVSSTVDSAVYGRVFPACDQQHMATTSEHERRCLTFNVHFETIYKARSEKNLPRDAITIASKMPLPGRQYLVFLFLYPVCRDADTAYISIRPASWIGSECGVFEVVDSKVVDTTDYFGLGTNPSVNDVISIINSRIRQIVSYQSLTLWK
ncbi:MAG: hypothetical protein IPH49_09435 [Ignavibacteria bacterium]|nr:hypothetical protein [Ignavibacteria bacterium]MBK7411082.1 hypothetical protein [Ignavibacteria bacterium]